MTNDTETQRETWHTTAVSWGQFLIGALGIAGSIFAAVWVDRLAMDRRLTIVEERQAFVLRTLQANDLEIDAIRADIARRLDAIQAQLVQISIDLARHQSRVNEGMNGGNGK